MSEPPNLMMIELSWYPPFDIELLLAPADYWLPPDPQDEY
jgi:hypothetical protein